MVNQNNNNKIIIINNNRLKKINQFHLIIKLNNYYFGIKIFQHKYQKQWNLKKIDIF